MFSIAKVTIESRIARTIFFSFPVLVLRIRGGAVLLRYSRIRPLPVYRRVSLDISSGNGNTNIQMLSKNDQQPSKFNLVLMEIRLDLKEL